ncbi:MAG: rod shape-determining protein MreD [Syntrophaceae bacterium]
MIYYVVMPIFSLLLLIFQVSFLDLMFFGKIGIEISLIVVIYAGFHLSIARGGSLAFVMGFIFDCITGSITGFHTFFYVLVFLAARLTSRRVYSEGTFFIVLFALAACLAQGVFLSLIYSFIYNVENFMKIMWIFIIQSIIAGFLSPAVFLLLDKMESVFYVGEPQ